MDWLQIYILHYMDDLLLAAPDPISLECCFLELSGALDRLGLQIVPDKVQTQDLFSYLGLESTPFESGPCSPCSVMHLFPMFSYALTTSIP